MYPMYGNMNNMGMTPNPNMGMMPNPNMGMTLNPNMGMTPNPNMGMQGNTSMMPPMYSPTNNSNYSAGDSNSSLTVQVNNLEKRVARLEGMMSSNTANPSYSESNFYMV